MYIEGLLGAAFNLGFAFQTCIINYYPVCINAHKCQIFLQMSQFSTNDESNPYKINVLNDRRIEKFAKLKRKDKRVRSSEFLRGCVVWEIYISVLPNPL